MVVILWSNTVPQNINSAAEASFCFLVPITGKLGLKLQNFKARILDPSEELTNYGKVLFHNTQHTPSRPDKHGGTLFTWSLFRSIVITLRYSSAAFCNSCLDPIQPSSLSALISWWYTWDVSSIEITSLSGLVWRHPDAVSSSPELASSNILRRVAGGLDFFILCDWEVLFPSAIGGVRLSTWWPAATLHRVLHQECPHIGKIQ